MSEYKVTVDGKTYDVYVGRMEDDRVDVTLDGRSFTVEVELPSKKSVKTPVLRSPRQVVNAAEVPDRTSPPGKSGVSGDVLSPLPGVILKILVKEGDLVREGQAVATMEAMKMENEVESPVSGRVSSIPVKPGETILENALIMKIEG
jgi:glutaconyl-CoA/methylmalonyl-CoA decarboxylase subunit gamma